MTKQYMDQVATCIKEAIEIINMNTSKIKHTVYIDAQPMLIDALKLIQQSQDYGQQVSYLKRNLAAFFHQREQMLDEFFVFFNSHRDHEDDCMDLVNCLCPYSNADKEIGGRWFKNHIIAQVRENQKTQKS